MEQSKDFEKPDVDSDCVLDRSSLVDDVALWKVKSRPRQTWMVTNAEGGSYYYDPFTSREEALEGYTSLTSPVRHPGVRIMWDSPHDKNRTGNYDALHYSYQKELVVLYECRRWGEVTFVIMAGEIYQHEHIASFTTMNTALEHFMECARVYKKYVERREELQQQHQERMSSLEWKYPSLD